MFGKKLPVLLLAFFMVLSISSSVFAHPSDSAKLDPQKRWASVNKTWSTIDYPVAIYYDDGMGYTGNLQARGAICFTPNGTNKTTCDVTYEGYLYYSY